MKKFTPVFSFALALCTGLAASAADRTPMIVGGEDAEAHAYPFIASLQMNGRHYCAGSIINENTILTASHCVSGQSAEKITVSLGRHNIKADEDDTKQLIQVESFVMHPDFSMTTLKNDVALIYLENPIEFNDFVKPIELADADSIPEGKTTIAGWGRLEAGWFGGLPDVLQVANVDVVDFDKCVEAYAKSSDKVAPGMMCAASPGIDTCQGDSGGPLFQDGKLLGITSWGRGCANKDYPGVYTQVSYFLDFINSNIKS